MKKSFFTFLLFLGMTLFCIVNVQLVLADITIYIRPDGTVEATDLIERDGEVFTFTGNIYAPIVIERNNIIVDGAGFTLEGMRLGDAINLTTSNVTIENIHIVDWGSGILGAYNNNTITGNVITGCDFGIKIYARNYSIIGNYIANNEEGIRLADAHNLVSKNNITHNNIGINFYGNVYDYGNVIVENSIEKNFWGIRNGAGAYQTVYHNDFVNNTHHIVWDSGHRGVSLIGAGLKWDDGVKGNFWSDYNGTDNDGDGIGDTPYFLNEDNKDNHPLMVQFNTALIPEFPSWIILPLLLTIILFAIIIKKRLLYPRS